MNRKIFLLQINIDKHIHLYNTKLYFTHKKFSPTRSGVARPVTSQTSLQTKLVNQLFKSSNITS